MELRAVLDEMSTWTDVANELRERDITGLRPGTVNRKTGYLITGAPTRCPIAQHLKMHFPHQLVTVGQVHTRVGSVTELLPPNVVEFIRAFDGGAHPPLHSSG